MVYTVTEVRDGGLGYGMSLKDGDVNIAVVVIATRGAILHEGRVTEFVNIAEQPHVGDVLECRGNWLYPVNTCDWCRNTGTLHMVTIGVKTWRLCNKCERGKPRLFVVVDLVSNVTDDDLADYRERFPDMIISPDVYIDVADSVIDYPADFDHVERITVFSCALGDSFSVNALVGRDGTMYVHFEHFC